MADATNVAVARESWGKAVPEWVLALAAACDARGATQRAVGKRIGYTDSVVNQVLRNKYPGRMDKVEARIRGSLMSEKVDCPVQGAITTKKCVDNQAQRHLLTNEMRVELRRACPRCPNRLKEDS